MRYMPKAHQSIPFAVVSITPLSIIRPETKLVKESSIMFVVGHSPYPDVISKTMNKGFGGVQDTSLLYVDANLCAIGVAGSANKGDITGTSIS